ncbi:hypothetical protein [Neobacillus vireti]|uniref:DUF1093 domain-containing protein n=1 Tax=Neobacillus vireti LMG 21834 TaxID=1131730 RepID=A0AB94IT10_9BACI|nr:hypothetical protein [Neobacillus vireti]ETI70172.1 hypothetical protein BAVI_03764 [Neobacillus vireti LMG 21834]KLT16460.1 hypothetical protein AA980_18480 [Neobacillus vireti]
MLKRKRWLLLLLFLPIVIVGIFYIQYASLDVYKVDHDTITYKDRIYYGGSETYKEYYDQTTGERKFEVGKVIGKTNTSSFFGFKETVYEIKGKPVEEVVFLSGLMFEEVLKLKTKDD